MNPIRAIEIKLSQGAKPGRGGLIPAANATPEIAKIRGIERGKDFASSASYAEVTDVDSLLDFLERLKDKSDLPVGIKSADGQTDFWQQLADKTNRTERGVDFITIDGGEGGTGAAPLVFSDHVAMPFKLTFTNVFRFY
ncbi:MAG: glutamate synthase-related protein [Rubripirellula sp.]